MVDNLDQLAREAFARLLARDGALSLAPVDIARLYLLHTSISTSMFDILLLMTKVAAREPITMPDLKEVNDSIVHIRSQNDEWLRLVVDRLERG